MSTCPNCKTKVKRKNSKKVYGVFTHKKCPPENKRKEKWNYQLGTWV